ncbi:sigma-70 family RNA polymerase sigma factor [Anopheles sinensis]|uniref:Sigma-70 family RNA polymerase sigma factor n=1 Tax=Anopheles sinensis TaxID=74873 RepID=A0A084W5Q9_ANOSI|nr:sigma-70 family RNA polymerase sigma factor [Anopheles sinensis]
MALYRLALADSASLSAAKTMIDHRSRFDWARIRAGYKSANDLHRVANAFRAVFRCNREHPVSHAKVGAVVLNFPSVRRQANGHEPNCPKASKVAQFGCSPADGTEIIDDKFPDLIIFNNFLRPSCRMDAGEKCWPRSANPWGRRLSADRGGFPMKIY